ncbi:hypothetical protein R3W88_034013 [Solanum pinnatisectum]|uniref:Reverse transcriptase zinc-binding domain-containing protein n=1 Tax=Solanum pinnatisectum TaxID=50273 RepID=A0AAV9K1F3_9SOLN|nr:hypothetical protein R3W88_034013 [Solanum pinnatisectum]
MMRNKHTVDKHILWKLRNGSSSFWWDNWLGVGPLARYSTNNNRLNNDRIADFMENGHIRVTREETKINTYTWHKRIPFKCSFLLWRAIQGKLPTNKRLASFGIEPGSCYCCRSPGVDTIEHTFNTGIFAKKVWNYLLFHWGFKQTSCPLEI